MSLSVLLSIVFVALCQSQTITIANHAGANAYWYAVTVDPPSGTIVSSLKMKDSQMTSYEEGLWAWDYYYGKNFFQWSNYQHFPYKGPFSFQVTLSTGQVLEGTNIISSFTDFESGTVSMSGAYTVAAYTAKDETVTEEGLSAGAIAAIVMCSVLFGCLSGALVMVCYQKRNKVIVSGIQREKVDDEEVMVDVRVTDTMQLEA